MTIHAVSIRKARRSRHQVATIPKRRFRFLLSYPAAFIFLGISILVFPQDSRAFLSSDIYEDGSFISARNLQLETLPLNTPLPPNIITTSEISLSNRSHAVDAEWRQSVLEEAFTHLGVPYVWGGASPRGFDCSGYVEYVFGKAGIRVQRPARIMYRTVPSIDKSELLPGDLVFFANTDHVGIYIGKGKFIHASSAPKQVTISNLNSAYYTSHYIGSGRVTD